MKDGKSDSLLELMKKAVGCTYISDLYAIRFDKKIVKLIQNIPLESYGLSEWNESVSYIIQSNYSGQTIEEAKAALIRAKYC